jgi:hypothetical protein
MAIRRNLLSWQYKMYGQNHQHKANLAIHIATVPLFWIGLLMIASTVLTMSWKILLMGAALLLIPIIAQGIGHKKELAPPEPFTGPMDFVSRFFAEQLITFPRWLLFRR